MERKIVKLKKRLAVSPIADIKSVRRELREALRERRKHKKKLVNPLWIKIDYVRYADDWLVGVWGPYSYVKSLKHSLKIFLQNLKLELSEEKTLITNLKKDTAKFLGVIIGTNFDSLSISKQKIKGFVRRASYINVTMTAPIKTLLQRLENQGFLRLRNGKYMPLPIRPLSVLPTIDLIIRYRSILRGFLQYYSYADNIRELRTIYSFLKSSLEKTIRYKENLTREDFYRTYGKNVKINILKKDGSYVSLDFPLPNLKFTPMKFLFKELRDPLLAKIWKVSKINPLDQPCVSPPSRGGN